FNKSLLYRFLIARCDFSTVRLRYADCSPLQNKFVRIANQLPAFRYFLPPAASFNPDQNYSLTQLIKLPGIRLYYEYLKRQDIIEKNPAKH
ncbi:MAG TPA: hypothetical protein VGM24_06940, partial [Puia sp.]